MAQKSYDKALFRLISILSMLVKDERPTISSLAEEFNVSKRTIQTDIYQRLCGWDITKDKFGRLVFMDGYNATKYLPIFHSRLDKIKLKNNKRNFMIEDYKDDEAIKESVAVLLMDMIKTDYIISDQERDKFVKIFASYYKMTEAKALELFEKLSFESGDLDLHIAEIKEKFHNTPIQKLTIMKHLNEMIFVDWIVDIEYDKFDKVKNALI